MVEEANVRRARQVCETVGDVGLGVLGEEVGGGRVVVLLEQLLLSRMMVWRGSTCTVRGPTTGTFTPTEI